MKYSFELIRHPNIQYREPLIRLSICELTMMLESLSVSACVHCETLGNAAFLSFESRELTESELCYLSRHSSICFFSINENERLLPVAVPSSAYLPEDLPEVLKYKGKTNASFTRMMINTALSLTPFFSEGSAVTVADPLCGKGTSLFSAVQAGFCAIGIEKEKRFAAEAEVYFSKYLMLHGIKHQKIKKAETVKGSSVPVTEFIFSATRDGYRSGDLRSLRIAAGDTSDLKAAARGSIINVIVADLPYGIQHAPSGGGQISSFQSLLDRALPAWAAVLARKGSIAVSFNTLTLPRHIVVSALSRAGFSPIESSTLSGLKHSVEQAVVRDVVFAIKS